MRRTRTVAAGLCLAAVTLAGCSADETGSGGGSGGGAAQTVSEVDITFSGDTVEPNGERVQVEAGEPLTLHITADEPGELHVHSDPEQELAYDAGESKLELTLDQPGVVEVESHDLELTILQLEVR